MIRHKNPVHLPQVFIPDASIDSAIKQFILAAESFFAECMVINKPELPLYYSRYFALNGFEEHNLTELGEAFNVTRERARQRINILNNALLKLIHGDLVLTPRVDYNIQYTTLLRSFISQVDTVTVITKEEVLDILQPSSEKEKEWVYPLMAVAGFVKSDYNGIILYRKKSLHMKNIREQTNKIDRFLREKVLPVSIKEIALHLKAPLMLAQSLLYLMPHVENKDGLYFLHDQNLISVMDCIYRIFHEKQRKLSKDEIKGELIKRGVVPPEVLNLSLDGRFVPVGKTGVWGLKKWNIDNSPIYEVMLDALRFLGKPANTRQLSECVKNRRPNVRQETIYTYLAQYKDLFVFFEGGLVAPREDRKKYPHLKLKRKSARKFYATQEQVDKIFRNFLNTKKKATSSELYEELVKYYPYTRNGFYIKLMGSQILQYDDSTPRLYSIDKTKKKVEYLKKPVHKEVEENIIKILRKKKGYRMAFPKLIKQVCTTTGCNKVMVYKVVSQSDVFSTKLMRKDSRAKEIRLVV